MSEVFSLYRGVVRPGHGGRYLAEHTRDSVIREVAAKYRLTADAILSRRRCRAISWPRQEVMWRLRQLGYSFPEIGRVMSRDHTTAIHACHRHEERNASEFEVAA